MPASRVSLVVLRHEFVWIPRLFAIASRKTFPVVILAGMIRTSTSSVFSGIHPGLAQPVLLQAAQNRGFGFGAVFGSQPLGHGISTSDAEQVDAREQPPRFGLRRVRLLVFALVLGMGFLCKGQLTLRAQAEKHRKAGFLFYAGGLVFVRNGFTDQPCAVLPEQVTLRCGKTRSD